MHIEYSILPDEDYFDKEYIKEQIRRYSHFKDAKQINDYVEKEYEYDGNAFLGKKPISVIQLITEGVAHFTTLRQAQKLENA